MQTTQTQEERRPLDRMRDAWNSSSCPVCETPKRDRHDWFCKQCWWALPKKIQNALIYRPWQSCWKWEKAMEILKEKQQEKTGTHG